MSQLQHCHPYPNEYRNTRGFLLKMDSASYLSSQKTLGIILRFRETAYLPLPKANINTYFSRRAKCWLRGGVGGQFPRNVKWSGIRFHTFTSVLENECLKVFNLASFLWKKKTELALATKTKIPKSRAARPQLETVGWCRIRIKYWNSLNAIIWTR